MRCCRWIGIVVDNVLHDEQKKEPGFNRTPVGRAAPDRASAASKQFPVQRLHYCDAAYC
jgi:hypothetical protein